MGKLTLLPDGSMTVHHVARKLFYMIPFVVRASTTGRLGLLVVGVPVLSYNYFIKNTFFLNVHIRVGYLFSGGENLISTIFH